MTKGIEIEVDDGGFLRYEPGWAGAFTRATAKGAMPSGSRIVKSNSEADDATPDGTPGVVLGSLSHPSVHNGIVVYFVEWANRPKRAMAVMETKVRSANE